MLDGEACAHDISRMCIGIKLVENGSKWFTTGIGKYWYHLFTLTRSCCGSQHPGKPGQADACQGHLAGSYHLMCPARTNTKWTCHNYKVQFKPCHSGSFEFFFCGLPPQATVITLVLCAGHGQARTCSSLQQYEAGMLMEVRLLYNWFGVFWKYRLDRLSIFPASGNASTVLLSKTGRVGFAVDIKLPANWKHELFLVFFVQLD